jgi:hypothetical protein
MTAAGASPENRHVKSNLIGKLMSSNEITLVLAETGNRFGHKLYLTVRNIEKDEIEDA